MDSLPFDSGPVAALRRKRDVFGWPPRRRAAGFVLAFVALIISAVVGASVFGLMHFRSAEASGASMSLSVSQNGPVTCSGGGIHRKCKVLATKSFTLGVTASVPPPRGYTAYQVVLQFTSGLNTGAGETKQPCIDESGRETFAMGRYELTCKVAT